MVEFTASHFAELCRQGPVKSQIESIETARKAAVGGFWRYLVGGLALAAAVGFGAATISIEFGFVAFFILAAIAVGFAIAPLSKASRSIKLPVLETIAGQGGMSFTPEGFDPPVFADAQQPLFGNWLSAAAFSDLFYGTDPEGRHFAFYEAILTRGHGKHRHNVFTGQIYAFQRRRPQQGETVAVPDKGLFNFFKPAGGFERIKFETDPDFEKKFEVYTSNAAEAQALFGNLSVRRLLLELRQQGRIFVFVGHEDMLVAVTGKNRFEPGSMFRSRGGEERVRLMFDDVCASLGVLNKLKAGFG
ncbi:DUF3137 domain-containing protein [Allosphingosinicella sp.]|jgi:hypothetical protein|uniref:DUF3137 domain-containing protein n=1 Tax=Allosphingosinicella sp. TaxID=2823234 RepID=UPI002EF4CA38